MNRRKLILPAISIGLLTASRPASADVIDLGTVAEGISVGATLSGFTFAGNTVGGFTLGALTFVGSHLNDVINGNTVTSILENILGPQVAGEGTFNLPGPGGASGSFLFNESLALSNGQVTFTGATVTATVTECFPAVPGSAPLPGCHSNGGATIVINPYDAAQMVESMENAQIIALPGVVSKGATVTSTGTITIPLGSFGGNSYQAEEIESFTSISAAVQTPEPPTSYLAALGMAALAWWRRLRLKRR